MGGDKIDESVEVPVPIDRKFGRGTAQGQLRQIPVKKHALMWQQPGIEIPPERALLDIVKEQHGS
jgi:hypothetical protein